MSLGKNFLGLSSRKAAISPINTPRVLLIDEEARSLRLMSMYLRHAGFLIQEAATTIIGLDYLKSDVLVDLIVIDININYEAALIFIETVRTEMKLPVTIIAISSDVSKKRIALRSGANLFFLRPINGEEFLSIVKSLLTSSHTLAPIGASQLENEKGDNSSRILLVDDSVVCVKIFSKFLRESGYTVVGTEDADSAYELISNEDQESFDLILLDISMPLIDGVSFIEFCLLMPSFSTPIVVNMLFM